MKITNFKYIIDITAGRNIKAIIKELAMRKVIKRINNIILILESVIVYNKSEFIWILEVCVVIHTINRIINIPIVIFVAIINSFLNFNNISSIIFFLFDDQACIETEK